MPSAFPVITTRVVGFEKHGGRVIAVTRNTRYELLEPGSLSFWLRNDGLVCIFSHFLFRRKIMLEREPLMDALSELRERILEWDRPKDNNS